MILAKVTDDSVYTLPVKNFVEIALSCTVSKTHMFLYFMQNFKMAAKNGGKNNFDKYLQMTLHTSGSKISSKLLFLTLFPT